MSGCGRAARPAPANGANARPIDDHAQHADRCVQLVQVAHRGFVQLRRLEVGVARLEHLLENRSAAARARPSGTAAAARGPRGASRAASAVRPRRAPWPTRRDRGSDRRDRRARRPRSSRSRRRKAAISSRSVDRASAGAKRGRRPPSVRSAADSVREQRVDLELAELVAPLERGQLDHEREAGDLAAQTSDELDRAHHRPAGGEQVVHDEHALARGDRVGMDLERGGAVLELVLDLDRLGRAACPACARARSPRRACTPSGAEKMKPRDSIPTTTSTGVSPTWSAIRSITSRKASGSLSSVVMS